VRNQRVALRRLRELGSTPPLKLPFLFDEALGREAIERLAGELEGRL
jgi:hypothetical protein